jgi:hypothetical protein
MYNGKRETNSPLKSRVRTPNFSAARSAAATARSLVECARAVPPMPTMVGIKVVLSAAFNGSLLIFD